MLGPSAPPGPVGLRIVGLLRSTSWTFSAVGQWPARRVFEALPDWIPSRRQSACCSSFLTFAAPSRTARWGPSDVGRGCAARSLRRGPRVFDESTTSVPRHGGGELTLLGFANVLCCLRGAASEVPLHRHGRWTGCLTLAFQGGFHPLRRALKRLYQRTLSGHLRSRLRVRLWGSRRNPVGAGQGHPHTPLLSFLPTSAARSVHRLAGLLHPAADHGVHVVSARRRFSGCLSGGSTPPHDQPPSGSPPPRASYPSKLSPCTQPSACAR